MIRTLIPSLLLVAVAALPADAAPVTFDFAHVGNAGNTADPETGYGAVSYNYAISKTEVTNAQYTAFLNAVDPTGSNSLALYTPNVRRDSQGIELQALNPNGNKFVTLAGRELRPVTTVSFFDAMRFVNWLHNGQGSGDTETGVYAIGDGLNEVRSSEAHFWIPSEDEWYKAAYHDANAGTAGVYFDYATGSDAEPISDQPGENIAAVNYFNDDGVANGFNDGYAVTGMPRFPVGVNPYTDVGAYTGAASTYGTFDQNGNVWEWNESLIVTAASFRGRGIRGGSWNFPLERLKAANRFLASPGFQGSPVTGFRVATVPEPTASLLSVIAVGGAGFARRSRRDI